MSHHSNPPATALVLQLILALRLELNAIESALKNSCVLSDSQLQEIRRQASQTAEAWSHDPSIDILTLIQIHSSPAATMLVPLSQDAKTDLRREINTQTPPLG